MNSILDKRTPQKRATRLGRWKRGMTYQPRGSRSRSHHSSPRAGKPLTWQRVAGIAERLEREVREMRTAETIQALIRERLAYESESAVLESRMR
jgi:hypothetical protein